MIPSTGRGGRRRGGRSAAARLRSGGIGSWWTQAKTELRGRPGHEFIAAAVASAPRRPAISRDATPPLLPGWKEPSYKSPLAKTEPKLRVGLQIPSLDEARRKPEAHHTVAAKKFSVSLPAPSPEEDRVHKEFRTTPRFSPDEKPKKRRSPEEKPRRRRFPVVPAGPRIVDIEPDYKPGPRTAARRRVHARLRRELPASSGDAAAEAGTPPPPPPTHQARRGPQGGAATARARAAALESRASPRLAGHAARHSGARASSERNRRTVLNNPSGAVVN